MSKISKIEIGVFMKLFNRGGYVLDFSTNDFDVFTLESVGVALCDKYQLSKGKSLLAYINQASEDNVIKLLKDLFDYYTLHFENEYTEENEEIYGYSRFNADYCRTYKKCKKIAERVFLNSSPLDPVATKLKEKFSSEYISTQIDIMLKMQTENPTEAIGKAKEFIESCCKTILESSNIIPDKRWDISKLTEQTTKLLKITPKDIPDTAPEATAIKSILGNLRAIATNVATIRNVYGSGHGKSASYKGLEARHAKLAVGSSITLVNFLWDSYEKQVNRNEI